MTGCNLALVAMCLVITWLEGRRSFGAMQGVRHSLDKLQSKLEETASLADRIAAAARGTGARRDHEEDGSGGSSDSDDAGSYGSAETVPAAACVPKLPTLRRPARVPLQSHNSSRATSCNPMALPSPKRATGQATAIEADALPSAESVIANLTGAQATQRLPVRGKRAHHAAFKVPWKEAR